jgi:hypothetical protein
MARLNETAWVNQKIEIHAPGLTEKLSVFFVWHVTKLRQSLVIPFPNVSIPRTPMAVTPLE